MSTEPIPCVYHLCPPGGVIDDTLYPLHLLESAAPDVFAQALRKYDDHPDRRNLPFRPIPMLDCEWRDVVQCSPVHPHALFLAMREAGQQPRPSKFIVIPVDRVSTLPAVVFTRDVEGCPHYEPVNWTTYTASDNVPEKARSWYRNLAERGQKGAIFNSIPHLFIKGAIAVAGCEVIDWSTSA